MFRRFAVLRPFQQRLSSPSSPSSSSSSSASGAVSDGPSNWGLNDDAILRFTHTAIVDPASNKFTHPSERKVCVEFRLLDLPLSTVDERNKFIALVGPRYNPNTDVVKLTSERHSTMALNKEYLRGVVKELLEEARRPL